MQEYQLTSSDSFSVGSSFSTLTGDFFARGVAFFLVTLLALGLLGDEVTSALAARAPLPRGRLYFFLRSRTLLATDFGLA